MSDSTDGNGERQRRPVKKIIERTSVDGRRGEKRKDLAGQPRAVTLNPKTGRPQLRAGQPSLVARYDIDPERIKNLAAACLTPREIAAAIGCDVRTLRKHFTAELEQGRSLVNARARMALHRMAMKGHWPALKYFLEIYLLGSAAAKSRDLRDR